MRLLKTLALLCFFPLFAHAELPPSAYEAMQAKASDTLKIEVLQVEIEPGDTADQQKVHVMGMVNEVQKTTSDVKVGDLINIYYTVTNHPKGWAGPGAVPIPVEKEQTVAYLTKNVENGQFAPAAGRMSFSNF